MERERSVERWVKKRERIGERVQLSAPLMTPDGPESLLGRDPIRPAFEPETPPMSCDKQLSPSSQTKIETETEMEKEINDKTETK